MKPIAKNRENIFSKKRAFTLVEILVYIGVAVIIFTITISALVMIVQTYKKVKSVVAIEESATLSLDRIVTEIKKAKSIDLVNSVIGSNPGKLVLNTTDMSGSPTTIEFSIVNFVIYVKEGSSSAEPITNSSVIITNLVFRTSTNSKTTGIKIEMTAEAGEDDSYRSNKFYDTAIMRNS